MKWASVPTVPGTPVLIGGPAPPVCPAIPAIGDRAGTDRRWSGPIPAGTARPAVRPELRRGAPVRPVPIVGRSAGPDGLEAGEVTASLLRE
ncbi:hypothetical protein TBS_29050 [Thermobispora bispora]